MSPSSSISRTARKSRVRLTLSAVVVAVWDRALRNYGPNLGFDWGGRLMAAWLDR